MTTRIHPTAIIDPSAELGDGVAVGPYAIVGPRVTLGPDTEVRGHAQVLGPSRLGRENVIYGHACVGFDPQDLKFRGEETWLQAGDRNQFREGCTVNRGTEKGGSVTRLGSDNLLMTGAHIGHDSHVGSRVVFANNGTLAGHVTVEDDATIGAFSAVHQYNRVGVHAYIGGFSVITLDALPYAITVGHKPKCYGLNRIGLERKGVDPDHIRALEQALRVFLRSGLNTNQALAKLRAEHPPLPEILHLIQFVESSERGVVKGERRGSRGSA